MFRQITLSSLLSLVIIISIFAVWVIRVKPSDLASIKKKMQQQESAKSKNVFATTEQQRKGVVKEIWFSQEDNTRLHYRIFSESSLLTIQPEGKRFDLIEKLEKIKCWMQDKLYEGAAGTVPSQQVRFLVAKEGLYRYATQEFLAQSVGLSLFRVNGHELPRDLSTTKPFLKGIAEDVSFAVSGKIPQFQAKHFKAELGDRSNKEVVR